MWDPAGNDQAELYRDAVATARRQGLSVLAVTLDPDPVSTLRGTKEHPSFQDVEYRLWLQAQCGIQSRIVVTLTRQQVENEGASFLFDGLREHVEINRVLLRPGQSLGRGMRGSASAIRDYCDPLGIGVDFAEGHRRTEGIIDARRHLARGELSRASQLLSQKFYCARPASGRRPMTWPPGAYAAVPVELPTPEDAQARQPIYLTLEPWCNGSRMLWPDDATPWLAFIAGPGDHTNVGD
ncbi:hypothetical protein [Streptomyces aureus]|uniref:hypothetical protein n=1 Tax=Streptomyces aureus TaxID=193461 RepID=UPI00131B8664|nr:hypothetical protein [Streptomyces aureus]